jgi:hypothetical protein
MPAISNLFIAAATLAASPEPDLSWLSGHWRAETGTTAHEEIWTDMRGGLMLGANRTLRDGEAVAFEFMRIRTTDGLRYCAQPGGGPATCFDLAEHGENHIAFENADHDFPQRVVYRRADDELTATISDLDGEQSYSWSWRLAE